jgi:hypothetical protein
MDRAKSSYGLACAVVEFSSDQRKAALARAMVKFLDADESAASADAYARASDGYSKDMAQLKKDYQQAEETRAQYFALKARWETARSRASAEKAMSTLL